MNNVFIIGLSQGEREYEVNGVKYTVASRFLNVEEKTNISDRFKRCITNDFAPLTMDLKSNKIADEYVCSGCVAPSGARKED